MTSPAPDRFRLEKHRWIAELVRHRTFADVGGLGDTVNETVSLALRHGAREATMLHQQTPHSEAWTRLKQGQCLLVPTLSDAQRAILREHFDSRGMTVTGINRDRPFITPDGRFRYGPWWWLLTTETFFGMCRMFNVRVENTWVSLHGSASVLVRLGAAA